MITEEKPALDEDLLMHFGIRGMKWGHRKPEPSGSGAKSSAPKQKMSTKKKVAIGAGVAVGAAAAAYLISRRGKVKVPKVSALKSLTEQVSGSRPPSPFEMRVQAGQAAHRNTMNAMLSKKNDLDIAAASARIKKINSSMDGTTQSLLGNTDAMLRAMQR